MRSLMRITASLQLRWLELRLPRAGVTEYSLLEAHASSVLKDEAIDCYKERSQSNI